MERQPLDPEAIAEAADVAADYEGLQGLTAAMQGFSLVFMGLTGSVIWGSILMAFSVLIGQGFYYKKYGKASQDRRQFWMTLLIGVPLLVLATACIVADHFVSGPIAFGALAGAVYLIGFTKILYSHVGGTRLHTITIGALAASSLLPLLGFFPDAAIWRYSVFVIGLAMLVIGAADHVRLTRALAPRLQALRRDVDA